MMNPEPSFGALRAQKSFRKSSAPTAAGSRHRRLLQAGGGGVMARTAARTTQADIARAIRAAKQAGAKGVEVRPDGTIHISLDGGKRPVETWPEEVVL